MASPTKSDTTMQPESAALQRSQSTSTLISSSSISPTTSPRVQLIPWARSPNYNITLSEEEQELVGSTQFDSFDLASKEFEFDDIFTYGNPQQKLTKVVEISSPSRQKELAKFSYSHYSSAASTRPKVNRARSDIGEMYLRNRNDVRKQHGNT